MLEVFNSKFFDNVKIKYDEKIIYCDNLELEMSKNIAVAYGNVLIKDKNLNNIKDIKINIENEWFNNINIERKDIARIFL